MKTQTLKIAEQNYQLHESRNMISKIIDNQINNIKLHFLTEWERDHSLPLDINDEKITLLKNKKKDLNELFNKFSDTNYLVDFDISIDVKFKKKDIAVSA